MKVVLDTSALIRYFTNDSPEKARKVQTLLETEKNIIIPDVVFPELEYVLTGHYGASKAQLIEIYRFLLSLTNVKIPRYIKSAIAHFEKKNLDFADCIIASQAEQGTLASFDTHLLQSGNGKPYWKK